MCMSGCCRPQRFANDGDEILESVRLGRNLDVTGLADLATELFAPGAVRPADTTKAEQWSVVCKWTNLLETVGVMVEETR